MSLRRPKLSTTKGSSWRRRRRRRMFFISFIRTSCVKASSKRHYEYFHFTSTHNNNQYLCVLPSVTLTPCTIHMALFCVSKSIHKSQQTHFAHHQAITQELEVYIINYKHKSEVLFYIKKHITIKYKITGYN